MNETNFHKDIFLDLLIKILKLSQRLNIKCETVIEVKSIYNINRNKNSNHYVKRTS